MSRAGDSATPERTFALWIPSWPPGVSEEERAEDPGLAERLFAPVLAALEEVVPGVDPLRPGLCALRGRGPTRYYGGEEAAAAAMIDRVMRLQLERTSAADARIGIADGVFAARQAVRATEIADGVCAPSPRVRIVPSASTSAFLAPLPVERAAEPELADTLRGLGIRTLGQLAALPEGAVRERFGPAGVSAHRRARAAPPAHGSELHPRQPALDLAVEFEFDPPVETADRLAFACAQPAERLVDGLAGELLVCTELRVELADDIGVRHERVWAHPRRFTAVDIVNRVRWQLESLAGSAAHGGIGIAHVRLSPSRAEPASAHEPALWSAEPDERVHHRVTQVQNRLGYTGVGTAQLSGGRLLAERQQFVPWGTSRTARRPARGPWPGALPDPIPSAVFPDPLPAELLNGDGDPIEIAEDDVLHSRPARLRIGRGSWGRVTGWSPLWPLRERWWEGRPARWRLQVQVEEIQGAQGGEIRTAWLLLHQSGQWFAEGRYD